MFAFFVVMFATAQTDKTKAREVAATVREALQPDRPERATWPTDFHSRRHY